MEKLFTPCETVLLPDRKLVLLLVFYILHLMEQRHILLSFTQSIQSCSMLAKGKRILVSIFKNYVSLAPSPEEPGGLFHSPLK